MLDIFDRILLRPGMGNEAWYPRHTAVTQRRAKNTLRGLGSVWSDDLS